jgi:transposase
MNDVIEQAPVVLTGQGSDKMLAPQEVQKMQALSALGWGAKRISRELGCSRNTVREYLRAGGWRPMDVSGRAGALEAHSEWLSERLRRHRGNADVVRQDLARELGIEVSLRTVQRAVGPMRRELRAEAVATVRYETAPGQQLQIDFGSTTVQLGEDAQRVHLFVATLGYSRRCYVAVFLHERQSAWLQGLEGAFRHFGGVPHEVLIDNAKALVDEHNVKTREVKFNDRFHAFCRYWGVTPRACAPYRARTKGKDERGVGYVKRNAVAGHSFESVEAFEAHLARWMREVADTRVHGTTKPVEVAGELEPMLTRLKLTAVRDQLDTLLDQAGRAELNLREALTMLCTAEVARKDERRIQMGMSIAKFPCVRTLEGFEYDAQPSVDPKQIRELATSRWVANGDSVLLLGPPGVGKTHLAVALGREAIVRGYSTLFVPATSLVTQLARAHAESRLEEKLLQLYEAEVAGRR